jgi:hypothetical protein
MVVGILRVTLLLPDNHTLKGKRSVLARVKARVARTFNVSIAECDHHNLWQTAVIGIAQVGPDARYVEGGLRKVVRFVEELHIAEMGPNELEILHC